jgi:NAD(P)-dependent dehydrogenase (short-subunit alcohol dehydrogenase family)
MRHAAFALGEALRSELQAIGIGMTLLCPGLLNTNIWDGARARPDRFGGPQSINPAVATRWLAAKRPDLMWPHVERAIASGGGYLVCATDGGEIEGLLERRTRAIRGGIERI